LDREHDDIMSGRFLGAEDDYDTQVDWAIMRE